MIDSQTIEELKKDIIFSCEFILDDDDDISVRKSFISLFVEKNLRKSKLSDDIMRDIIEDICNELVYERRTI